MNVALPSLPAVVQASGGAEKQEDTLLAPASNLGTPSEGMMDLPLFIDVLSQVLPSSLLAPLTVQVSPESVFPGRATQDAHPAEREPALTNASVEGVDTGLLPAAWDQGAWSAVLGGAAQGGEQEHEKPKRSADADAPLLDAVLGQPAASPWLTAPLPLVSLSLSGVVSPPSGRVDVAIQGAAAQQAVSLTVQDAVGTGALASMAPSLVHQPSATADFALPPAEGVSAASISEQAQVSALPERAALIQGANALAQAGDAGQPLALNPRQPDLWQRPLAQALGERLQVQGAQGEEQALIRLDPPSLGRVEILLRQEGGTWQVQLSATHPEVNRQLQAISETLRHELSVRQQASVTVQVTSDHLGHADGRQQRQRQDGQQPREPGRAWDGEEAAQTFDLA